MSQHDVAEEQLDLRTLLAVLLQYWKFILSFFLLCLAIGVFYALKATPVYMTDSTVQVEKATQGTTQLGTEVAQLLQYEASPAATEIELMKSRRVLLPVINDFHLDMILTRADSSLADKLSLTPNNKALHNKNGVSIPDENAWVQSVNVPSYYYDKPILLSSSNGQDFELSLENEFDVKGTINKPTRFITKYGNIDILVKSLPTEHSYFLTKQAPSKAVDVLKNR